MLTQLLYFQLTSAATMSKNQNSSYQGFRRKNSLNSHDSISINSSEISLLNMRKEDLKLIENLSMELENKSKRSLTPRSFSQHPSLHNQSCRSVALLPQTSEKTFYKTNSNTSSLRKIELINEDFQSEPSDHRKQRNAKLSIFNNFDIIEESRSNCEEEVIDDFPPITLKTEPAEKNLKKSFCSKPSPKIVPPAPRKAPTPKQEPNMKKDRVKIDMGELDKMQKELQTKRTMKEIPGTRSLNNSTGFRKQSANLQLKDTPKMKLSMISNQPKNEHQKITKNIQKSSCILGPSKMSESKHMLEEEDSNDIGKAEIVPMAATRMLSYKQKMTLVGRLQSLRQIIEKNEVCFDSIEFINSHIASIQKLLTK